MRKNYENKTRTPLEMVNLLDESFCGWFIARIVIKYSLESNKDLLVRNYLF